MPLARCAARRFKTPNIDELIGEAYLQLVLAVDEIENPLENKGLIYYRILRALKEYIARDDVICVNYHTLLYKKKLKRICDFDIEQKFNNFETIDFKDYLESIKFNSLEKKIIILLCDGRNINNIVDITGYCRQCIYDTIKSIKEKLNGCNLQEL